MSSTMAIIGLVGFLLVPCLSTAAQPADTPTDHLIAGIRMMPEDSTEQVLQRQANQALRRSLLGTLLPMTGGVMVAASGGGGTGQTLLFGSLFWGGALFGPSFGYFHGGATRRGLEGLGLRVGIFGLAWLLAPTRDFDDGIFPNPEFSFGEGGDNDLGVWVLAGGAILVAAIYDIARVRHAVHQHARSWQEVRVRVVPLYTAQSRTQGVLIRVVF